MTGLLFNTLFSLSVKMEVHDLIEHGYKCKECQFFTTTDEDIKEHISSSHFWLLAKKQKLSDPVSFQDPNTVKTWKNIFQVTAHDVTKAILGSLDNETFLACRLVCCFVFVYLSASASILMHVCFLSLFCSRYLHVCFTA